MAVDIPIDHASNAVIPLRWLEMHGDSLYAYAIRRVRRSEAAEDLVQDTLLSALQGWDKFSHRADVRTWLIGILRRKICDHFRNRYRDLPIENSGADVDQLFDSRGIWKAAVGPWKNSPAQLIEQREFRVVLDRCLSKLPSRMAHLFLTRSTTDATTSDLCLELNITSENAWMLLHRARSRLRECLSIHWFDGEAKSDSPRNA